MVERAFANFTAMGWIVLAFAGLGLVLSGLGVYGLFAGYVAERTREIGVRMALGAEAGQVLGLMLAKGLRLAALGVGLGLLGALSIGPVLTAAVEALPTRDPVVLMALAAALVAVALFACWLPARRAAGGGSHGRPAQRVTAVPGQPPAAADRRGLPAARSSGSDN